VLHWNIHFLYPKLDEIKLLNFDKQLNVICFCETFLNDSFSDHELSINNYNMFRRCTRRSDLESISLEYMVRNQTTVSKTIIIMLLLQAAIW